MQTGVIEGSAEAFSGHTASGGALLSEQVEGVVSKDGECLGGVLGQPFQAAAATVVFEPLSITDAYLGTEPPRRPALVADIPGAAGTPIEHYNSRFHQSLGLPSNGLLATAEAVLALLGPFQDRPDGFLRTETRRAAITSQTGNLAGGMPNVAWARADWGLGP